MSSKDAPFDREAQARKASAKSTCSFCDSTSARKSAEQSTIAETGVWFPAIVRCIHRPVMFWPVMNAAPGELSQSTALAISSGVPMRPTGVCVAIVFFMSVSPSPKARSNISVWMGPGETLLTRMPCLANRRDLDKI